MILTEKYERALTFAHQVHREQKRKGTDIPYISHLIAVSSLVLEADGNEDEAVGALLHDSIEDCPKEYPGGVERLREDIRWQFGNAVLEIVEHCSDTDEIPKPPWRKRKEAYISAIAAKPDDALLVSCADKLHNARAILSDYRTIGEELWERFNAGKESLWYYQSLVQAFRQTNRVPEQLLNDLEITIQELHNLVSKPEKPKRKPAKALPNLPDRFDQKSFDMARIGLSGEKQRKAKRSVAALKRKREKEDELMKPDLKFKAWVLKELKTLQKDEEYSPFKTEIEQTVEHWEHSSPKMYAELKQAGLLHQFAQLMQAKMWEEMDSLQASGMPHQDAREQAIASWMLLSPEAEA